MPFRSYSLQAALEIYALGHSARLLGWSILETPPEIEYYVRENFLLTEIFFFTMFDFYLASLFVKVSRVPHVA
jgi:hypothetical protein